MVERVERDGGIEIYPPILAFRTGSLIRADVEPGAGFTDVQQRGPMRSWVHRHEYRRVDGSRTRVTDRIWYEHPSGGRGVLTRGLFTSVLLASLFRYRAWATRRAVEAG